MHRFHLRSSSFWVWAVQQPIPAMYNFANRFEVQQYPPDFISADFLNPLMVEPERRYLNHFPARVLTFANTRYIYLRDGQDRWVTIESSYRGQQLETKFHAKSRAEGGYDLICLSEAGQP